MLYFDSMDKKKSKIIGGVFLLLFNVGIIFLIYSVPFSSSDEIELPEPIPDSVEHLIVFCGFVQCPTICPTSLQKISEVYESLNSSEISKSTQLIFVNLEPELEYGQTAQQFADGFHEDFIGWQLEKSEQSKFLDDLHTFYLPSDKKRKQYAKHSPNIYLLNRKGDNAWNIAQIYTNYPAENNSLMESIFQSFNRDDLH